MIKSLFTKEEESRWIDQSLVFAMTALTLFAMGQATQNQTASMVLIAIATAGSLVSYFAMKAMSGTKMASWDAAGLVTIGVICIVFLPQLDRLLPSGSFDGLLWTAGFLSWIISLGSFALWRDQSRVFQAVPCIALFGLIGVYDTYAGAVFAFFAFLLCLSWLFSRAHTRMMLHRAFDSGFSRIDEGVSLDAKRLEQDAMLRAMRKGPWRMMAGPEWALGSAAAVVLISILGAPLLQETVKSVTGNVAIVLPAKLRTHSESFGQHSGSDRAKAKIGQGPVHLSDRLVGSAVVKGTLYLQSTTYSIYDASGWSRDPSSSGVAFSRGTADQLGSPVAAAQWQSEQQAVPDPKKVSFSVALFDSTIQFFPVPPVLGGVSLPHSQVILGDGSVPTRSGASSALQVTGWSLVPSNPIADTDSLSAVPFQGKYMSTERVRELAREVTKGKTSDWDKAEAIKEEIARRCVYDTNTPAVPEGQDPVDWFLFDSHRGYCELFASAMTVMARSVGINSRYVIGYLLDQNDVDADGNYNIRERDAHAWSSLDFNGAGWVTFDATEGADAVTSQDASSFLNSPWVLAAVCVGAIGLAIGLMLLLRKLRPRFQLKFKRKDKSAAAVSSAYDRFCGAVERRTGQLKQPETTLDEYIRAASISDEELVARANRIANQFDVIFYGSALLDESTAKELNDEIQAFAKDMRQAGREVAKEPASSRDR